MRTLLTIATLTLAFVVSSSGTAQTVIPAGPFDSVELRNGGHVTIRQGATQRVTLISGDPQVTRIAVEGQRLVIDSHGKHRSQRRSERLEIEIVTPELTAVAISNGGKLEATGAFSAQSTIAAQVDNGGILDVRAIPADAVTASVESGGRIFTNPRRTLTAKVRSGGGISYLGDPQVTQSVRDGGAVMKEDE